MPDPTDVNTAMAPRPTRLPSAPAKRPLEEDADCEAGTASSDCPRTPPKRARSGSVNCEDGVFAKYVLAPSGDALDALAAVASSTPRCSAAPAPTLSWLRRLTSARRDVSAGLPGLVKPGAEWHAVLRRAHALVDKSEPSNDDEAIRRREETLAVYFAAVEGILAREKRRGAGERGMQFVRKLVRNERFHKGVLACALETVRAAYSVGGLNELLRNLEILEISPFELTKAIESFVRRLPECPRQIAKHLLSLEVKIIESAVWRRDSDLIALLFTRGLRSTTTSQQSAVRVTAVKSTCTTQADIESSMKSCGATSKGQNEGSTTGNDIEGMVAGKDHDLPSATKLITGSRDKLSLSSNEKTADTNRKMRTEVEQDHGPLEGSTCSSSPAQNQQRSQFPDLALELFYKKLLAIASERMVEMLALTNLQALTEQVWAVIKHAVWEKWYLLVDRHLDQIILCSIYGVTKVRRIEIKFRALIQVYRNLTHVADTVTAPAVPSSCLDIPLRMHVINGTAQGPNLPPTPAADPEARGDIIKMYNLVYMPIMKPFLLQTGSWPSTAVPPFIGSSPASLTARTQSHSGTVCDSNDPVSAAVLQSPVRMRRANPSPRKIGRVTVSPMSPRARQLVALRQSPGQTVMTPNTRTLYAFGESPVRPDIARRRNPVPLSFERTGERTASIRRMYAEVLSSRTRSGDAARRISPE